MNTGMDLRNWAEEQRSAGVEIAAFGDLLFQIFRPKLTEDEIQFNIRRNLPGEEPDIKFEEHPDSKKFWVFALPKDGAVSYPHAHEELSLNESVEKLKELFPDGRFDYVVDNLLVQNGD